MDIVVEKAGILATIQDLGRPGYARHGINPGGVMDRAATRLINVILGNDESSPVIEMHFPAPVFRFERSVAFALGGADLSAELDGLSVANWRPHLASRGSRLSFKGPVSGVRAYLACAGGFSGDEWLGSRSTHMKAGLGGARGRALRAGDCLNIKANDVALLRDRHTLVSSRLVPSYRPFPRVRVVAGPEFEMLDDASQQRIFSHENIVSKESDRMGYRLISDPLVSTDHSERISAGVTFGTIQLLPDGQLILLMADHQTSGGYPRVLNVISRDLPLVAQIGPSDRLVFELVGLTEAERLAAEFEHDLSLLRTICKLTANTKQR